MKVSASVDAANRIPGDNVAETLGDLKIAVRTNPGLAIVGVCSDAGLGGVFDTALDLGSAQPNLTAEKSSSSSGSGFCLPRFGRLLRGISTSRTYPSGLGHRRELRIEP